MLFSNRVGIVLATYNGQKYLYEQLVSIATQSVKPDIVVISDGGSSDDTVCICKKVLFEYNIQCKILTSDRRLSVRENFEKCLENCDAKYIFFSDQDDVWLKTKIEEYLCLFEKYKPAMIFSNASLVDEKLKPLNRTLWETINYDNVSEITVYKPNDKKYYEKMVNHNIVTGMCMAIDRSFVDEILPFSQHSIHDIWIANVVGFHAPIVAYNRCLVKYRQHPGNVVGTSTSILKAYSHKNRYITRLDEDILFWKDVIAKCTDKDIMHSCCDLKKFLEFRKNYIANKENIISIVNRICDYKRFSNNWKRTIVKDIYARYFIIGIGNDTKK